MKSDLIIVFDSTHHAIKAEGLLKDARIAFDIIPTPRDISSDCGIAVRTAIEQRRIAESVLNRAKIEIRVFERAGRHVT